MLKDKVSLCFFLV
uniref:Uncharacterized protein n=1 Tax=Rhizophora mucronata TaxID=61149 RepID=A0A2P2NMA5_RHIMU